MKKLTVLAALGLAAISSAQVNYLETPSNISLRLGYVLPIDNTMKSISNSYLGVGIDFNVSGFKLLEGAETTLSVDWFGKSGSGAHGNAFPICINQRWYQGDALVQRSYVFAGLGLAIVDLTSAKTVLAIRGGYGKEFGDHLYGELSFTYTDAANGARATSAGVYLGYKF